MLTDRPFGAKRSPAQVMRNLEALQALRERKLQRGELFALVMGIGPRPSNVDRVTNIPKAIGPDSMQCMDCGGELYGEEGDPLGSQPRRCRPCGRSKRQAHNAAQRGPLRTTTGTKGGDNGTKDAAKAEGSSVPKRKGRSTGKKGSEQKAGGSKQAKAVTAEKEPEKEPEKEEKKEEAREWWQS